MNKREANVSSLEKVKTVEEMRHICLAFSEWVIPTNPNSPWQDPIPDMTSALCRYNLKEFLYCTSQAAFWASCVGPFRGSWDFIFGLENLGLQAMVQEIPF